MLVHCNRKIRPYITQFLRDKDNFIKRKLEIGICPECLHQLAKLTETRIQDNKVFETEVSRRKAEKLIKQCSNEIEYTSNDSPKQKGLFGFRYGETKEKTDKEGNITITHKACDFYGNKEIIETKNI